MIGAIGRRLVSMLPLLLFASFVSFSILYVIPGDPVLSIQGSRPASPEMIERIRSYYNLDQPFLVRYYKYVEAALSGDFGISFILRRPVSEVILQQLPATVRLALLSLAVGLALGITLGTVAAVRANTASDSVIMSFAVLGNSIPSFWLGLMLILVFALELRWLPIASTGPTGIIMPTAVLATVVMARFARLTRSSLLEVLRQDYVRTARSKGLPERVVVLTHALRNALLPVTALLGVQLGDLLTGSIIVETVFARQGVGRLTVESVLAKDIPVVQALVLLTAVVYMGVNLIVDVFYAILDPRIRLD